MAAKAMAEEAPGMPEKDGDHVSSADTVSKQAAGLVAVTLPVSELQCPICVELMSDPFVTACGHTFCHPCLTTALKHRKSCPQCGNYTTEAHIFPNFLLSQVLRRASVAVAADQQMQLERMKAQILDPQMSWSVQDLDVLLSFISDRRRHQQFILEETNLELLNSFLAFCRSKKAGLAQFLKGQARVLEEDIRTVSGQRQALQRTLPTIPEASAPGTAAAAAAPAAAPPLMASASSTQSGLPAVCGKRPHSSDDDGASRRSDAMLQWVQELVVAKKQHVASKFNNLEKWYLQMRTAQPEPGPDVGVPDVGVPDVGVPDVEAAAQEEGNAAVAGASDAQGGAGGFGRSLDHFTEALTMVMRYSGFRQLASIDLAPNGRPGAATLSSIEFDTSCTHLATAGVGRVVRVYNYASLLKQPELQVHAPVAEMSVGATVSSLSWNCHTGGQLLSSDYSGGVVLWDVASASAVQYFQAHSMRSWSVDYSPLQPGVFASASDDGTIKVWSAEQRTPVAMMDLGVNVCCVAWHPTVEHLVAAGTAGHSIAVYDVRAMKTALHMFAGHRKAVSHLRFMSQEELVSASTDSTLRIWQLPEQAVRGQVPGGATAGTQTSSTSTVFSGHHNEKNFVGLSVDRSFMACGSEDNFLHVYYRRTPKPMLSYSFSQVLDRRNGSSSSGSGARKEAAAVRNRFVSSVCWRRGTDQIVAATTGGVMCVVELVV